MGIGNLILWALPRAAWITTIVLVDQWNRLAEGGYGKDESNVFAWHSLCMTLAFAVFTTEAVLVYHSPVVPFLNKLLDQDAGRLQRRKLLHSFLHILALVSMVLGLIAIVDYKRWSGTPVYYPFFTLYSAHSWCGLVTLFLWTLQAIGGVISFALVGPTSQWKPELARFHRLLGKMIFVAGLATCTMGLEDMQSSDLAGSTSAPAPSAPPMIPMAMPNAPPPMIPMAMDQGTDSMATSGYTAHSMLSRLSAVAACMIFVIGISTFLTLEYTAPAIGTAAPKESSDAEGKSANGNGNLPINAAV